MRIRCCNQRTKNHEPATFKRRRDYAKANHQCQKEYSKQTKRQNSRKFRFSTVDLPFTEKSILGGAKPVGRSRLTAIRYHSADENPDR